MEQAKSSIPSRKGKHLNRNERILIEGFLRAGIYAIQVVGRGVWKCSSRVVVQMPNPSVSIGHVGVI